MSKPQEPMSLVEAALKARDAPGHTPGPWKTFEIETAEEKPSLGVCQAAEPFGLLVVADCDSGNCGPILRDADANLIAAAPELLEAAKNISVVLGLAGLRADADYLQEVIAKAEGKAQS